ncbi:hypothetical protein ACFLIM_30050 [Nonomuraea sp. M3C6]|uniref:Uncharacterized protein n=1 Tax=Nonomuraea marmarensis TaxID=3351344 RepID=A0ABW7AMM2_9ACTN
MISAVFVALAGGVTAALTAATAQNSGPVAAMPLIFSTYPEGGHASVPVESVRNDGKPKILAASLGRTLTLTGLLWYEDAGRYVKPPAEYRLWYGGDIGTIKILEVVQGR